MLWWLIKIGLTHLLTDFRFVRFVVEAGVNHFSYKVKLTISSQCTHFKAFIHYSQVSVTRKNTYNSSVLLTGLKRKRTFTSSPAVITNLITKEKLIQLLNTATNKQTQRVKNKATNNEVLLNKLFLSLSCWASNLKSCLQTNWKFNSDKRAS